MVAESNVLGAFSQIVVILAVAHLLGALAARFGQPPVIGKIAAGVLLGPTVLGQMGPEVYARVFSEPTTLHALSEVGLVLIMFSLGLEVGAGGAAGRFRYRRPLTVAGTVTLLTASVGVLVGLATYGSFGGERGAGPYVALVAIAMTATAVPVLGRIMASLGLARTEVGATALMAATVADVVVWLALSICVAAVAVAPNALSPVVQVLGLLALVLVGEVLLRPAVRRVRAIIQRKYGPRAVGQLAVPLVAVFVFSILTERLGLHVLIGAFLAGTIFRAEHDLVELWREKVEDFVEAFFVPLYFAAAGVKMDLGHAALLPLSLWVLLFFIAASLGKIGGSYLGARLCGFSRGDAYTIGVLMNTKGLVELVILSIGLELGIISAKLYTVLVLVALLAAVATAPLLRMRGQTPQHLMPAAVDADRRVAVRAR